MDGKLGKINAPSFEGIVGYLFKLQMKQKSYRNSKVPAGPAQVFLSLVAVNY